MHNPIEIVLQWGIYSTEVFFFLCVMLKDFNSSSQPLSFVPVMVSHVALLLLETQPWVLLEKSFGSSEEAHL
jgi:hypothetical protein